jgi:hypothetical protein
MTRLKGHPATGASPDVRITFREDVLPDQRRAGERSVTTLVARSFEAAAKVRAAEAELAKLSEVWLSQRTSR